MRTRFIWLAVPALAAGSMAIASTVTAASVPPQQRIMLEQKHRFGASSGTFVLHALTSGDLTRDVGRYTYTALARPSVFRKGQGIAVYVATATLTGSRGTLTVGWRVEYVGAGDGNTVGTGRWWLVRGTGAYSRVSGGGRMAMLVWSSKGDTTSQFEGLVTGPGSLERRPGLGSAGSA